MACEKHKLRKRPNSCPDCAAEVGTEVKDSNENIADAPVLEFKESNPIKFTGSVLVTGSSVELPVVALPESTFALRVADLISEPEIPVDALDLDEYRDFKNQELKNQVDMLVKKKLKEVEKEINRMLSIKHECIDIPLTRFNMKVLDTFLSDGWKLISFLTKDVAKVSGLKEDSVLLQRIKNDEWKKDIEFYKIRFREGSK